MDGMLGIRTPSADLNYGRRRRTHLAMVASIFPSHSFVYDRGWLKALKHTGCFHSLAFSSLTVASCEHPTTTTTTTLQRGGGGQQKQKTLYRIQYFFPLSFKLLRSTVLDDLDSLHFGQLNVSRESECTFINPPPYYS